MLNDSGKDSERELSIVVYPSVQHLVTVEDDAAEDIDDDITHVDHTHSHVAVTERDSETDESVSPPNGDEGETAEAVLSFSGVEDDGGEDQERTGSTEEEEEPLSNSAEKDNIAVEEVEDGDDPSMIDV